MGKLIRAWKLVDQVLGPYLANRLRRGLPIDIAAQNGQIYRIDPTCQGLINLTTQEKYCVHPVDGNNYCFPDMVIVWWDYLHLKPEQIERVVGGPGSNHRSPWLDGEKMFGHVIHPRSFATEEGTNRNIEIINEGVRMAINDPIRMLSSLPPNIRRTYDTILSSIIDFHSRGLISGGMEFKEVEENEEALEDDSEREDGENAECDQDCLG